jgi:flavin reductase (DIM6/NTAB) family NADH-FMN oxidoreductase RutF
MAASLGCSPCDSLQFRNACGKFPTGVTITTLIDTSGAPRGITINSFTSVSLEPPLILVCIDSRSHIIPPMTMGTCFGINVLSYEQDYLATKFSRHWENRFASVKWRPGETGVPLLDGIAAALECRIVRREIAGDHVVVFGLVLTATLTEEPPLTFANRGYGSFLAAG